MCHASPRGTISLTEDAADAIESGDEDVGPTGQADSEVGRRAEKAARGDRDALIGQEPRDERIRIGHTGDPRKDNRGFNGSGDFELGMVGQKAPHVLQVG